MIALQTLKYKIFEWCLDTLVGKLVNTFFNDIGKNKRELDSCEIRKGMKIDEIVCIRHDWVVIRYRFCKIIVIEESVVTFEAEMIKIEEGDWMFRYDSGMYTSWSLPGESGKDNWVMAGNNGVTFYQYL